MAKPYGFETRTFRLDEPSKVAAGLAGVAAVIHYAGPFAHTAKAMADGCLRSGVHYLDITGEVAVFESLAARDAEAKSAGVMLLPGAGFDVVPSDCLAAHLRPPPAHRNAANVAFQLVGQASRGTATTVVENLHRGGLVRRGGALRPVPAAWHTRSIDFGRGPVQRSQLPWGDVSTAYYSTGIPDIEVFAATPPSVRRLARISRYIGWFLASGPVQRFLKRRIQAGPAGPSDEEPKTASACSGEKRWTMPAVRRSPGCKVRRATRSPRLTALAAVEKVLGGQAPPGISDTVTCLCADFVLEIPGIKRFDI